MTDPITIEKIELAGFRAFLSPQPILLHNKKQTNTAIFGKNGTGKSSLVDSLEYYFSEKGTLNILGKKQTGSLAGPMAIKHLEAKKTDVATHVHIWFKQGACEFDDLRSISTSRTKAAERVLSHTKVSFIIRENDLHKFVLATTPNERYDELAGWLRMETLVKIQNNLKTLRTQIKKESECNDRANVRLEDLAKCTDGKILEWDESKILDWFNESILARLDVKNRFNVLSEDDPVFQELRDLTETEQKQTDLEDLKNMLTTINDLYAQPATHQEKTTGKIVIFEAAVLNYINATAKKECIQSETEKSVFNEVWKSAKILFEDRKDIVICPICETKFSSIPHGSRDSIYANISDNLSKLEEYGKAEKERDGAKIRLNAAKIDLEMEMVKFLTQVGSARPHGDISIYGKSLETWSIGKDIPDSTNAICALTELHNSIEDMIKRSGQNDEHAFRNAFDKAQKLLEVQTNLDLISRTKKEMSAFYDRVVEQSDVFNRTIVAHIQNQIDSLNNNMNDIYKDILGHNDVPGIRIEIGKEGGIEQRTAHLFIDLEDHKGLQPSGFQSQSQINTLALAFRLSAVRMFNDAKIIILDDIVSSYDEEHRSNIATVLDKHFKDFQIILSTHEQTFFNSLRNKVADKNYWQFKEIQYLERDHGPIFDDYKTDIGKIKKKHEKNETAGNDMRKLVEERLFSICMDFQTQIKIRKDNRYEIGELKDSLNSFLRKKKLTLPENPHGKFVSEILEKLPTLNLGSHSSYGQSSSVGDEKNDLKIIEYFLGLFVCPKCKRDRFVRKNDMPICKDKKCCTEFRFQYSDDTITTHQKS